MKILICKTPSKLSFKKNSGPSYYKVEEARAAARLALQRWPNAELHWAGTVADKKADPQNPNLHVLGRKSYPDPNQFDVILYFDWTPRRAYPDGQHEIPYFQYDFIHSRAKKIQVCVDWESINSIYSLAESVQRKNIPREKLPAGWDWDSFFAYRPDEFWAVCNDTEAFLNDVGDASGLVRTGRGVYDVRYTKEARSLVSVPDLFRYCQQTYNLAPTESNLTSKKEYDILYFGSKLEKFRKSSVLNMIQKNSNSRIALLGLKDLGDRYAAQFSNVTALPACCPKELRDYVHKSQALFVTTSEPWARAGSRILRIYECLFSGLELLWDDNCDWMLDKDNLLSQTPVKLEPIGPYL